ncbi:hypothetical protein [Aureimonas sp. N4]|uniref:hypothetical protein n=1 Tax=Aureimonas sp. N4 TaxID=1638165 RepID=UPI000781039D|nr:hypothetical protein [Aureimonas sp. N4]
MPLHALIDASSNPGSAPDFGSDIDAANAVLLDADKTREEKCRALLAWIARHQPCLFGRLGSRGLHGIGINVCWLDHEDIAKGDLHLQHKIQGARREWKRQAAAGKAHGFLIMFNDARLLTVKPSAALVALCEKIADLYLIEHAPVEPDVIYTEAIPLELGELTLFKAGINIFYPTAHRTRHHDRRCPGGLLISVNSPGHWANSLVKHGLAPTLTEAVDRAMDNALRSIGNGGMGSAPTPTCTWHNRQSDTDEKRRNLGKMPFYIPKDHSQRDYTALYHTDVLIPTDVTLDGEVDPELSGAEQWKHLILDYITEERFPTTHVNYALFHGHPIPPEAMFHNPWPPRRASNSPLAEY